MRTTPAEINRRARSRRYAMPTGTRETRASIGFKEIKDPIAANGIRRSCKKGGIMVVAELLWIVIATSGNRSFTVLHFISFQLFSKKFRRATELADGLWLMENSSRTQDHQTSYTRSAMP